jgi:hypothetical protein
MFGSKSSDRNKQLIAGLCTGILIKKFFSFSMTSIQDVHIINETGRPMVAPAVDQ